MSMLLATQLTDDQVAIMGCAIVFGGCLVMMMISQKIGDSVRGRRSSARVVPFPTATTRTTEDRKAA